MQVTITYACGKGTYSQSVDGKLAKVARLLASGEGAYSHLAKELFGVDTIRGHLFLFKRVGTAHDEECSKLCSQEKSNVGLFRQTSVSYLADFKWMDYIQELKTKAPTLLMVLSGVVSYSDRRNKQKCHYPGICMAAGVLLKE